MADTGQERGNAADAANAAAAADDSSPDHHHHLEESMAGLRVSDEPDKVNNAAHNAYPDRPGEPDCSYYMRTGTCAYGTNCRYNHPTYIGQGSQYTGDLPQREGQPECQFFLKTGTCRYGSTCKYHHPREKINTRPIYINSCGLPIREGEKPCPYYMKTGYCKFSVACKFSHPELGVPSGMMFPVPGAAPYQTGNGSSQVVPPAGLPLVGGFPASPVSRAPYMMSPTRVQGMPPYGPLVLQTNPNSQPIQPSWPTHMQGDASQADVLPGGNNNQMPGTINQTPSSFILENMDDRPKEVPSDSDAPEAIHTEKRNQNLEVIESQWGSSMSYNKLRPTPSELRGNFFYKGGNNKRSNEPVAAPTPNSTASTTTSTRATTDIRKPLPFKTTQSKILFGPHEIGATVTTDPLMADQWISEIRAAHPATDKKERIVVGLDCEWKPNRIRGQNNKVALLQICVGNRCLILQLIYMNPVPDSVGAFLLDEMYAFAGVEIDEDVVKLNSNYGLKCAETIDLKQACNAFLRIEAKMCKGLKGYAREILGYELQKSRNVTQSNWEDWNLTESQIRYACLDAFVSCLLGCKVLEKKSD